MEPVGSRLAFDPYGATPPIARASSIPLGSAHPIKQLAALDQKRFVWLGESDGERAPERAQPT